MSKGSNITKILCIVFALIMLAIMVRIAAGVDSDLYPSFTSFLASLANAPEVKIPFLSEYAKPLEEPWLLFDFIRVFLQGLITIVDFITFLLDGLLQIAVYVVFFFRWIFIV